MRRVYYIIKDNTIHSEQKKELAHMQKVNFYDM